LVPAIGPKSLILSLKLSFNVYSQNELKGSFEVSVKDLSDSFNLKLEQETLDFNSDKTSRIIFSAIAKKNLPSGLYPFQINLRSSELKIQRQYTRYIAYAPSESSIKKTMFSELFTATWCGYCPSAEKALKELDQHYANDDLLLLSYYLACKDEGSDLLCRPTLDKIERGFIKLRALQCFSLMEYSGKMEELVISRIPCLKLTMQWLRKEFT
jgi:thiol-disulfide isomerase/thioredoxin